MNKFLKLLVIFMLSGCATEVKDDLWLEEVDSAASLDWVRAQNDKTFAELKSSKFFQPAYAQILELLRDKERIPYVTLSGGWVRDFWSDEANPRGLWRRCSTQSYLAGKPDWKVLLDVDALNKSEKASWVFRGPSWLNSQSPLCMLKLSPGGSDAAVVREYDIDKKAFVKDGFQVPLSKTHTSWLDRDTLIIGTTLNEDEVTDSGYPRVLKLWKRGEMLESARPIFEADKKDISVSCYAIGPEEDRHHLIFKGVSFYDSEQYVYRDGKTFRLPLPAKCDITGYYQGQLIILLKQDWDCAGEVFPQGSLVAADLEDLIQGRQKVTMILCETEKMSIDSASVGRPGLFIKVLEDVQSRIYQFTRKGNKWTSKKLDLPDNTNNAIQSLSYNSDIVLLTSTGVLTPTTVYALQRDQLTKVDQLPARFETEELQVKRFFSTSRDGTQVPYLLVARKDIKLNASTPTLLYGYGGFEIPMLPYYSAVLGRSWLNKGGAYVIANIRGGGEYGPKWHQAALKTNRQRAYDDFISVAEELIAKKITSPQKLAIKGGSNGGLLMGVMLTQRPDLFKAVLCQVPLLDMLRYHKLLAGASWVGEYGDPENPQMAEYLKSYSPYHNLDAGTNYPEVFFMTSTRDDRVHPGHARRMAHKMIDLGYKIYYYENIEGGHGGAADHRQKALWLALEYSYLYEKLFEKE